MTDQEFFPKDPPDGEKLRILYEDYKARLREIKERKERRSVLRAWIAQVVTSTSVILGIALALRELIFR